MKPQESDSDPRAWLSHARYEARSLLGRGGQGIVLRVVDREDEARPLVAKIWTGSVKADTLAGEFALLSRNRIPGLVRAHDFGRDAKTQAPFLVEDFVEGVDALAWIAAEGEALRSERLRSLLAQVAATLSAMHALGVVHGDLKPAHVKVSPEGRATVLDLGSAVTSTRGESGPACDYTTTRSYAAPEVLAGGRPSVLSDLFALGALAWRSAAHRPFEPGQGRSLRDFAPWVAPHLADLVEHLITSHPLDRPRSADEVLGRLGGLSPRDSFAGDVRLAPIGREAVFERLLAASNERVRYLIGPAGIGKSHMARAVATAALLRGTPTRLLAFGEGQATPLGDLLAYLRGDEARFPFRSADAEGRVLVILDDLPRAPPELAAAVDLYRCRTSGEAAMDVLVTSRTAPEGVVPIELSPFDDAHMADLLRGLGVHGDATLTSLTRSSAGNPGLAVAWIGRVPLTTDAIVARTQSLSVSARKGLAAVAVCGGALEESCYRAVLGDAADASVGELLSSALLTRVSAQRISYALARREAAGELSVALADFDVTERVASALLASPSPPAAALLALADAPWPPSSRRAELLRRGIACASTEGLREIEMDLCFALLADPLERTPELLFRLERLTRDTGRAGVHPQVLGWLERAAEDHPSVEPLWLRRKAEAEARAGMHEAATASADRAYRAAARCCDARKEGLARATLGVIALYRADWGTAEVHLAAARDLLPGDHPDQEELARLEHNFGVVALYRGRAGDAERAFVGSLARKRKLGDRAGVRACLLNLAIALTKSKRLDEADATLAEAIALADVLGQKAGRSWCLAARADVEIRRHRPGPAERCIAEAEALGDAVPSAVRADLALLRASVRLLEGDGASARACLRVIDPSLRESDALVDARALVAESRALLASVPVDRRGAARAATRAVRRARGSRLAETEEEALAVLRDARRSAADDTRARGETVTAPREYPEIMTPSARLLAAESVFAWLVEVASGRSMVDAGLELAKLAVRETRAERAFVAVVDARESVVHAFGADIDGLAVGEALLRLPTEEVRLALGKSGPVYFRDFETPLGHGSRLLAASPDATLRGVIVLEHRSRRDCFDAIAAETPLRLATLAGVVARLSGGAAATIDVAAISAVSDERSAGPRFIDTTTSLPLRAPSRAFPAILGQSAALARAVSQLDAAIDSDLPVLIVGETGTGKELFARALHDLGRRGRSPFVAVNCGAVTESLFEAEFFGHARGSFTGADRARRGLLGRAEKGTLLLDEVGELPLTRQASLLRALETHRYRPVGSDEEQSFDARIVAATHRDLRASVEDGAFRRDLLFRLNVVEIRVPPLRERDGDVALLARHFLDRAGSPARLSPGAAEALAAYPWPGNVRELEHQMQRLAALAVDTVELDVLPREIRGSSKKPVRRVTALNEGQAKKEVERALVATGGNISHAAERLGVTRHGLKKRMTRLGIRKEGKR